MICFCSKVSYQSTACELCFFIVCTLFDVVRICDSWHDLKQHKWLKWKEKIKYNILKC